jgi:hypothetical protein
VRQQQSGHIVLIAGVVVIAVVILGLLGWVFWQNFNNAGGSAISNFEQCKASTGSKILETYPEQCITSDGRSFTGQVVKTDTVATKTYCTVAEKLCFEYREDWTIANVAQTGQDPGAKTDSLTVTSPNGDLVLFLETGIGGLGGTCPDEEKISVKVLDPIPAAAMTGYESEYSLDILQVARVVYPRDGTYIAALYLTGAPEYASEGTIQACGTGFSMFMDGKNSRLSADYEGAGAFRFGYEGNSEGARFGTEKEATDAFDSDTYKQGAALLASLRYQ